LAIIIPVLIFSCKKDSDEQPPTIEVFNPVKNTSYNTFDTIFVNALLKDEKNLTFASVELLDANLSPAGNPISKTLNTTEFNMNVALVIDNIHLTTGKHFLLVSASDGTNTTNNYTELHINGLPLITKGYMVFESNGNSVELHKFLNGTDSVKWSILGPFKDGLIDNYYQQAGFLQGDNGPFFAHPLLPGFSPWQLPADQGGITYCRSQPDQIGIQIGYKNGIMAIFEKDGVLKKTYQSGQNFYPKLSLLNGDNIITWQVKDNQSQNKIEVFFSSGAVRQVSSFNPEIVNMVNKSTDEIFIGANENGGGLLLSYGLDNGIFKILYDFPGEPIIALCNGNYSQVYYSTSAGIYMYDANQANPLVPILFSDIKAINMAWDIVTGVLILTTTDELMILNSFGDVLQTYPITGIPEKLQVWYSK
jgi:tellurite resistance-related uncharacterized protein